MDVIAAVIVITGAAARLTRLTTRDKITTDARSWLHNLLLFNRAQRRARAAAEPMPPARSPRSARVRVWLHTLVICDWCVGFWWSAVVGALGKMWVWQHVEWALIAMIVGTAAYLVGWLAEREQPGPSVVVSPQCEPAAARGHGAPPST